MREVSAAQSVCRQPTYGGQNFRFCCLQSDWLRRIYPLAYARVRRLTSKSQFWRQRTFGSLFTYGECRQNWLQGAGPAHRRWRPTSKMWVRRLILLPFAQGERKKKAAARHRIWAHGQANGPISLGGAVFGRRRFLIIVAVSHNNKEIGGPKHLGQTRTW